LLAAPYACNPRRELITKARTMPPNHREFQSAEIRRNSHRW
jgi:hypothetical protein